MKNHINNKLLDRQLIKKSLSESFRKLDPRRMIKNPIMFTVEVVTAVMLMLVAYIAVTGDESQGSLLYNFIVFAVLLATVLFANFAEAIAEARGKAQADSLRKTREETPAKQVLSNGKTGRSFLPHKLNSFLTGQMFYVKQGNKHMRQPLSQLFL